MPKYAFWNTTFHYDTQIEINFNIIKKLYNNYSINNCNGYLFSYSDEFKNFSAFHGSIYCSYKNMKNFAIKNIEDYEIINVSDLDEFSKHIDNEFKIGEVVRQNLIKLLSDTNKDYHLQSYFGYYKGDLCGAITVIECDFNNAYLFNLSILPKFKNHEASIKIVSLFLEKYMDKNIFTIEDFNDEHKKNIFTKLGFQLLGDHHLIDIKILYEYLQENR